MRNGYAFFSRWGKQLPQASGCHRLPAILMNVGCGRIMLQILRNPFDFARLIETDARTEANKLLDISIRPKLKPLAQETWNPANCAFDCHGGKYRNAEPCFCEKILGEWAGHDTSDALLLGRKYSGQCVRTLAFAFR